MFSCFSINKIILYVRLYNFFFVNIFFFLNKCFIFMNCSYLVLYLIESFIYYSHKSILHNKYLFIYFCKYIDYS